MLRVVRLQKKAKEILKTIKTNLHLLVLILRIISVSNAVEQVIGKLNVHPQEHLISEVEISVVEVNRVIEVEVEIFLKTRVILKVVK